MGTPPSERSKQAERANRITASQDRTRQHRRRRLLGWIMVAGVAAMVIGGLFVGFVGNNTTDELTTDTTPDGQTPDSVGPAVDITVPEPGASITGETPCPAEDGSSERTTRFEQPPPMCIDPDARYQAVIRTSEGDLTVLLDTEGTPNTVNNFVVLSRYRFYDGVPFYKIIPRQVMLTGDATGEPALGKGGPGYTIDDEIPEVGVIYPVGTLAMWNEAADKNGSRFFIATGEDASALPPEFTSFGILLDGMDALNAIQFQGDPVSGNPIGEVTIDSIDITELPPLEEEPADEQATTTTPPG